ncbi:metal ABC transporter substrate-binding protein [Sulfurimonas sp.]|nr:metal ABC transporter substrate-binding protein [Sulfurimonas sp.]
MSIKKSLFIIIAISIIIFLTNMNTQTDVKSATSKPKVSLSTFALYDIAKHIAQDEIEISMILPLGVDTHSYEPTPKQLTKLYKSDLLVFNGASLEPWTKGFDFKNTTLDISLHVDLLEIAEDEEEGHEEHEGHGHEGHKCEAAHGVDPHYWLDIPNMIKATYKITLELMKLSPKNESIFAKNRDEYVSELKKLDKLYKEKLSTCRLKTIVVNHNAFGYLSKNYGFEVEALSGLSPEAQPSPKTMVDLIKHVNEHSVKTIFFESFVSDKAIKSIAIDANVKVDVLQPLGNITANEAQKNLTYNDIMIDNLKKISQALECK